MRYMCQVAFNVEHPEQAAEVLNGVGALVAELADGAYVGKLTEVEDAAAITQVFTDGGCDSKKGVGSWAFIVENKEVGVVEHSGAYLNTTNTRATRRMNAATSSARSR